MRRAIEISGKKIKQLFFNFSFGWDLFIGFLLTEHHSFRYFVLELCDASLDRVLLPDYHERKYGGPKLPHHSEVLLQLAEGLSYIHSKQIIHRNINPYNVLISADHNPNVTMKWSGFSLSAVVDERGEYEMEGIVGDINWMAPELLQILNRLMRVIMTHEQAQWRATSFPKVFSLLTTWEMASILTVPMAPKLETTCWRKSRLFRQVSYILFNPELFEKIKS